MPILTSEGRNLFRPEDYAAVGDGNLDPNSAAGADDTAAFVAMFTEASQFSADVDIMGRRGAIYNLSLSGLPSGVIRFFVGVSGLRFLGNGSTLKFTTDYALNVSAYPFIFKECDDVVLDWSCLGRTVSGLDSPYRGVTPFAFRARCENIDLNLKCENVRESVLFTRLAQYGEGVSDKAKNIRGRIVAKNCGYGIVTSRSGDNLDLDLETERCFRSHISYAVRNQKIKATTRNHISDNFVVVAYNLPGTDDEDDPITRGYELNLHVLPRTIDHDPGPQLSLVAKGDNGACEISAVKFSALIENGDLYKEGRVMDMLTQLDGQGTDDITPGDGHYFGINHLSIVSRSGGPVSEMIRIMGDAAFDGSFLGVLNTAVIDIEGDSQATMLYRLPRAGEHHIFNTAPCFRFNGSITQLP